MIRANNVAIGSIKAERLDREESASRSTGKEVERDGVKVGGHQIKRSR